MKLLSELTALNIIAGNPTRSTPVVMTGSPIAILPTSYPATPQFTAAVPAGAMFAEVHFTYTGATGATAAAAGFTVWASDDGVTYYQVFAPYGYGTVDGPQAAATVVAQFVTDKIAVGGRAYVGVSVKEDADGSHPGALAATVVFLS